MAVPLMGTRFGRLVVIGGVGRLNGRRAVPCRCNCGRERMCNISTLYRGHLCSCGCLQVDNGRRLSATRRTHGLSQSPEFVAWVSMRSRCYSPNTNGYHRYGGRGVTVCEEWRESFAAFLAHVGRRPSAAHSLDRIDNSKGYEQGNVRWATKKQQQRNMRSNRIVTVNGVARSLSEWSEISGVNYHSIQARLNRLGWSPEDAVFTPSGARTKLTESDVECVK